MSNTDETPEEGTSSIEEGAEPDEETVDEPNTDDERVEDADAPSDESDASVEMADDEEEEASDASSEESDDTEDASEETESDDAPEDDASEASDEADETADEADEAAVTEDETEDDEETELERKEGGAEPPASMADGGSSSDSGPVRGMAAFFNRPDDLLDAARAARDSSYGAFDTFSPFPIHGIEEAMGIGRSWIPWVTFSAGLVGFISACALQFGTMTFDWPMIIGGKPFAPWPSFVPVMFELTVLIGGVTTAVVMLKAAGCFEPADVLDPELTNDRFALWISADDPRFDRDEVAEFMDDLQPVEIRTIHEEHERGS